ncbi:MAG: transporter substrate-binding domain-containing protein, partial [Pseudomonadota bacterium]|nr:transporter substrate-binding domain-containing protein [Pseudomonadota bacterium]
MTSKKDKGAILKQIIRILLCTVSVCGLIGWVQFISAAEAQSYPEKVATLKIGTMNLPPYGWINKQGKKQGIIYELGQEIGSRSGMPFTNKMYPFKRLLLMLKNGELDLISSQAHQPAL